MADPCDEPVMLRGIHEYMTRTDSVRQVDDRLYRRFRRVTTAQAVIDRAAKADIVYFGDYHPLESSQDWALRFMRDLAARGRKVVLALEMLYVHQQEHLDRWMQGSMTEEEFLETIDYRSEWGFSWSSFRRLFELAKDPFIPIFGIDSGPREHLRYIRRRDRLAARRIATIRRFFPGHVILVVIGESHLASRHLPSAVRSAVGERFRDSVSECLPQGNRHRDLGKGPRLQRALGPPWPRPARGFAAGCTAHHGSASGSPASTQACRARSIASTPIRRPRPIPSQPRPAFSQERRRRTISGQKGKVLHCVGRAR